MKVASQGSPYDQYYRLQAGGGHVFAGPVLQRGTGFGNIFKSLFRFIKPIFRAVVPVAKKALPVIGRELASAGTGFVQDVVEGQNVKEAAKARFRDVRDHLSQAAMNQLQSGSGRVYKRRRPPVKRQIKKRRPRQRDDIFH